MIAVWNELVGILNDSAGYLLVGFALAGLLHVALERNRNLLAPLTGPGHRPVILATLVGLPMPLCSCSVLPTGLTLLRKGASKGAVSSFMISVPETDIVSILLTYGLMGPLLAIWRPLASLVTGIAAGLAVNLVERHRAAAGDPAVQGATPPASENASGQGDNRLPEAPPAGSWLGRAARYGFVHFFDDLVVRLLIGIVIGAAIAAVLPALNAQFISGNQFVTYLIMLVVGVPMYVCATSSTPIAAALIAGGVSPGAALVFLLVGPATNSASILVLLKQFGRLAFGVYLAAIVLCSVVMGLLLDMLVANAALPLPEAVIPIASEPGPWAIGGTLLFLILAMASLHRQRIGARLAGWFERHAGVSVSRRAFWTACGMAALAIYLASGLFVVKPGERGASVRFGKVTSSHLGPGLHYHWPAPFGRQDILAVDRIRRVEIGRLGEMGPDSVPADLPTFVDPSTESWMLTGDENIIDIRGVVQYRIVDTPEAFEQYLYGISRGEQLVRAAAEWSVRKAAAGRGIDSLLTVDRAEVETVVRDRFLQPALDACGAGIDVVGVSLNSVHAPAPVHWAFRDVASAAEDAMRSINIAREYGERVVREARGARALKVALARGRAVDRTAGARGDSLAFVLQSEVYRDHPGLTRSRLYLEKLDAVLPMLTKYIDLTPDSGPGPDVWLRRGNSLDSLPFLGSPSGARSEEDR